MATAGTCRRFRVDLPSSEDEVAWFENAWSTGRFPGTYGRLANRAPWRGLPSTVADFDGDGDPLSAAASTDRKSFPGYGTWVGGAFSEPKRDHRRDRQPGNRAGR